MEHLKYSKTNIPIFDYQRDIETNTRNKKQFCRRFIYRLDEICKVNYPWANLSFVSTGFRESDVKKKKIQRHLNLFLPIDVSSDRSYFGCE